MPFTPPSLPSSLNSLLSSLRAPILQTQHNPLCQRLGTKYLRRRLRAPSMINYYPVVPSLRKLNLHNPHNIYANWDGSRPAPVSRGEEQLPVSWKARPVMGREMVEEGYEEMGRVQGAGWLWDEKEDARVKKVARRRRIGKGPPKKGDCMFGAR